MKKLISLFLLCVFAVSLANADIYTSVSRKYEYQKKEKAPIKLNWYAKAGVNIGVTCDNLSWDLEDASTSLIGIDINPGFYSFFRPSNPSEFYWGVDLNAGINFVHVQKGKRWASQNLKYLYANLAPQLGWRKNISETTQFDIHLEPAGIYISGDPEVDCDSYFTNLYYDDYGVLDGYSKIGIGIWYKKLIFDVSYRMPWFTYPGTITVGVGIQF